ncbi:MAG: glycosyltransferase family 1 protein [Candidatus Schekmanbacteria bacterium]|nr:MAG: glycosyltransferase family 1 protein [Candidatus Schekmanbacteria bacterium]
MKICSPSMGISPESDLGGEVYERELMLRLPESGAELGIILPKESKLPQGLKYDYIYNLPLKRHLRWFVSNPLFFLYLRKILQKEKVDLLRIHSLRFTGPAVIMAKKIVGKNIPVVAHHHHIDPEVMNFFVDSKIAPLVDKIITVSNFSKLQLMKKWKIEEEKIEVVYDGVSEKFKPEDKPKSLEKRYNANGKKVLLYLGSLQRRKNLFFLLECLEGLSERNSNDWLCLIAGKGKDFKKLVKFSEKLGLGNRVKFCGYVSENEKVSFLNLCDIFLFPSKLEGFGMAAVEAMACAKPVVALNTASLPEIVIDGKTGYLVTPEDKYSFIQRLIELIEDTDKSKKMGFEAANYVRKKFSWDKCAKSVMGIYEEVLNKYK